jgi:hypothetical protein
VAPQWLFLACSLLAILFAGDAKAEPRAASDLSACRTESARSDAEIVAPFADERTPNLPEKAVTIEVGEVLCLGGRVRANGEVESLTVVRKASERTLISLNLVRRDKHTLLEIRHASERWLHYRAARVFGSLQLAVPTSVLPVQPGLFVIESWDNAADRLVLFGFQLFDPPRPEAPRPRLFAGPEGTGPIIGVTGALGLAGIRLGELSDALARDGFATLPTSYLFGNLGVEGRFGPVRVGLPLEAGGFSTVHRETGEEIHVRWIGAGLYLGWDFLRAPGSSTFVALGLHAGSVSLDPSTPSLTLFRGRLAGLGRVDGASKGFGRLIPEIAHDRYFKLFGLHTNEQAALQVGGRLGYAWQFASDDVWEADDDDRHSLGRGPAIQSDGFRFRFVVGLVVD